MKLRNKKTGAIYSIEDIDLGSNQDGIWLGFTKYTSLAELNEEWEDYEEPTEFWWVNYDGTISHAEIGTMPFTKQKQIGNYFETKEEAEKAVEKLKAWKRLKDAGFVLQGWQSNYMKNGMGIIKFQIPDADYHWEEVEDLDILFGGEE